MTFPPALPAPRIASVSSAIRVVVSLSSKSVPSARMLDPRLLRALDRLRARAGVDRGRDPRTGRLTGALTGREAVAAGWATVGAHTYGAYTVHAGPGDRAALHVGAYTSIGEGGVRAGR